MNTTSSRSPGMTRRTALGVLAAATLTASSTFSAAATASAPEQKRVAIVTGSSRGIGEAIARRLAKENCAVTICYQVNRDLAEKVAADIQQGGGRAIAVGADVRRPADVANLFAQTKEAFGGVDVVINNAGVMRLAPMATMTDDDFDDVIDVNLRGGFNVLREGAKHVRNGGRIISTSSSITVLRTPTYGPYAASKAALEIFASVLAKELKGRQISVNAVAPGVVNTPLFTAVPGRTKEEIAGFAQRTPHGRIGEPEDIAATIAALVSSDGHWINGQTIYSNGGLV